MSIKPTYPNDSPVESKAEPFPKLHTIPEGWDMSGLMETYNPVTPEDIAMPIPTDEALQFDLSVELTEKYRV